MDSLDYTVVVSAIVLALSVLATAAKFFDWFIHSDPATMARTTRSMVLLLLAVCVPILIVMIVGGHWSGAMLLGAGMLSIPTMLKWRAVFAPLRSALGRFRRKARPFDFDMEVRGEMGKDPETVRRAAAILEAYVTQGPKLAVSNIERMDEEMSEAEALEVLVSPARRSRDPHGASPAHQAGSSDHAGSTYRLRKVSAKDTLLPGSSKLLRTFR